MADGQRRSVWLSGDALEALQAEMVRLDRPMSWLIEHAWMLARQTIAQYPSVRDILASAEQETIRPVADEVRSRPPNPAPARARLQHQGTEAPTSTG